VLVEHNLRRGHGIRLLPQPRVSAKCGFACRLIICASARSRAPSIAARATPLGAVPPGVPPPAESTRPCRLHIPCAKRSSDCRDTSTLSASARTAIDDPRPVPGARTARQGSHSPAPSYTAFLPLRAGRAAVRPGFARRLLEETTCPTNSAVCTSGAPSSVPTAVSLLACFSLR